MSLKDRQQVITAVLLRSQLNDHCERVPEPLYYYYISSKGHFYMLPNDINHMKMFLQGLM